MFYRMLRPALFGLDAETAHGLAIASLNSDEARRRFLREAKAAAALDHPNVCTVHEVDESDGAIFIAMAYLEGRTLDELVATRPLAIEKALDIAIQAAEGLESAHQKSIVHRDIKPSNLMVLDGSSRPLLKIMDFGLARLTGASKLTQNTTSMGTGRCEKFLKHLCLVTFEAGYDDSCRCLRFRFNPNRSLSPCRPVRPRPLRCPATSRSTATKTASARSSWNA